MKATTLQNRINKSLNKDGSQPKNLHFQKSIEVLLSDGEKVYVGYYSGSGRFSKACASNPGKYLRDWKIDYEYGNDAPRGGVSGDFVKLTKKGIRQCKNYLNDHNEKLLIKIEDRKRRNQILEQQKQDYQNQINEYASLISKVENETHDQTAGRLKSALGKRILDNKIFWQVVKQVRKS